MRNIKTESASLRGPGGFQELARKVGDDGRGEVTLRGPDGVVFQRRYLHTPEVVAIVAVTKDDELVLINEFRAAVGEVVLQVPMGKLPPGEDALTHAGVELAEETGFQAGHLEPLGTLLSCPGWMDQVMHVFHARDLMPVERSGGDLMPVGRSGGDEDDYEELHSTVVRLPIADLGNAIRTGVIRDARTIAAIALLRGD